MFVLSENPSLVHSIFSVDRAGVRARGVSVVMGMAFWDTGVIEYSVFDT